jgi:hypothetical protein
MTMIDLTPILQAVIALAAVLITAFVIPWIKSKTTKEQQELLRAVVSTLVVGAEQIYGAGNGEKKLAWVLTEMERRGYTADRVVVEAQVKNCLNWLRVKPSDKPPDGGE